MVAEETYPNILKYLKREGPLNTFRLATNLNVDRYKLLNVIEKLEKAGAVEVQHGMVKFLKFAVEEEKSLKKPAETKKTVFKPKRKHKVKKIKEAQSSFFQNLKAENEKLTEKVLELESKLKELEQKPVPSPKIITKTIIKKVPIIKTVIKKIRSPPKIITRIVTKNVPVTKTTKKVWQKLRAQPKKIKILNSALLNNIQQLKKPEFIN